MVGFPQRPAKCIVVTFLSLGNEVWKKELSGYICVPKIKQK
jgi:hypothetical protein